MELEIFKGGDYVVEVRKKSGESFGSLLRRFNKRVQQSGILFRARNLRFFQRKKSKRKIREDAKRKKEIREKIEELRKLGKYEEFQQKMRKKF